VSTAAADLEAAGLLDRTDGYTLTEPERLLTLVVRYADSFDADAVAFADDAASLGRVRPVIDPLAGRVDCAPTP